MNTELSKIVEVFECLAGCNEQFIALSQWLVSKGFKNISHSFDIRAYESGSMVEAFVEAELRTGSILCWWLEVTWHDGSWQISSSVLENDDDGQKVIKSFDDREPRAVTDLVSQLKEATRELTIHAETIRDRCEDWP